jgi:ribulose-bisphosphate carboxylase large chain
MSQAERVLDPVAVPLSGERFSVLYRIAGDEATARARGEALVVEQTVEFPPDLLPPGDIPEQIVGRIERFRAGDDGVFQAEVSYAVETTSLELTQLLNVVFGNSSLLPGIRVERLSLSPALLAAFRGPRFGRQGLRDYLQVPDRPILSTAIKPMGLSAPALAELVYQFALGGIDIIKDDHGLSDQPFAPFGERVARCAEAVARANAQTGFHCVYMPNVTGSSPGLHDRAHEAKLMGAGALIISPGLAGLDAMRALADDDALALPLMSHPAFLGGFVTAPDNGIAHGVLLGQIMRLAGADASVFPNFGGRFSFTVEDCRAIAAASAAPLGALAPIFPTPGGGMSIDSVPEMHAVYGREVIYLIGGNLYRHDGDLAARARQFRALVEGLADA